MAEHLPSRGSRTGSASITKKRNHIPRNPNNKKRSRLKTWQKVLLNVFLALVTLGIIGVIAGIGVFAYYASSSPKVTNAALVGTSQSQLLDKQGNVIWVSGNQKREIAAQSEIPDKLRQAVISVEDRRFYQHNGVDPRRIIGAAFADLTGSSLGLQGGSTLTQQLIKLTVFSTSAADQTLKRKAQDAWLAIKLEKQYSKNQILTLYMNKVYEGNGIYGMKTAASYYYGKDMKDLTIPEMALIAGMPQSPTAYDPYTNPKYAKARRDEVLLAMSEPHYDPTAKKKIAVITKAQAKKYMAVPITKGLLTTHEDEVTVAKSTKVSNDYITSVLNELKTKGYNINTDGLTVQTNLNMKVQQKAYDLVNDDAKATAAGINFPDDKTWNQSYVQTGITITDPRNGNVMAQIGSRKSDTLQGLNRATQTTRSSGSTANPLVDYGPPIEYLSWSTAQPVPDIKAFTYKGTSISVGDWGNSTPLYKTGITMRKAITSSLNVPALNTLQNLWDNKIYIDQKNGSHPWLSKLGMSNVKLSTGSAAIGIKISTEQEAAAFGGFSNGGTYYKPNYINSVTTQDGVTHTIKSTGKRAMKTSTAYMITSMLKSVTTVNDLGYYSTLNPTSPSYTQAGKSGTSDYASDSKFAEGKAQDLWFTGYTKSAVISVWNGYDEPNNINVALDGISGSASGNTSRLPLQIYHALMNYVMSEESNADGSKWKMPSTVEESTTSAGDYNVKDADPTGVFTTDSGTALTASVGIGMNSADATTQIISSSSSSAGISSYSSSSSSSVKSSSISSVSSSSSSGSSSSATTTSTPASGATDNTSTAANTNTSTTKSNGN